MRMGNGTILVVLVAALKLQGADPKACTGLVSYRLSTGTVTKPDPVESGAIFAYCRVTATLTPTFDSSIRMELWLPLEDWNGKLEANGNGGWTGSISPTALSAGVKRGYASAMSD